MSALGMNLLYLSLFDSVLYFACYLLSVSFDLQRISECLDSCCLM